MKTTKTKMIRREAAEPLERDVKEFQAVLRAATFDEESRSVEAVLATETPVQVWDWRTDGPVDEILLVSGIKHAATVPMLDSHNRMSVDDIRGTITDITVKGNKLVGKLNFARDAKSSDAMQKVADGHLKEVSVGAKRFLEKEVTIAKGEEKSVGGQTFRATSRPMRIMPKTELREVSLVPLAADPKARIREAQPVDKPEKESKKMNEALRKYLEHIGLRADASEVDAWAFCKGLGGVRAERAEAIIAEKMTFEEATAERKEETPKPEVERKVADDTVDHDALAEAAVDRAQKRIAERAEAIRKAGAGLVPTEEIDRAIAEGLSVEKATAEFLDHMRKARPEPVGASTFHIGERNGEGTERALGQALALGAGLDYELQKKYTKNDKEAKDLERAANDAERYLNHSMFDLVREAGAHRGVSLFGPRSEVIERVAATGTLSTVFSTVVNKSIMIGFQETEDTTQGWTTTVPIADFRTNTRFRLRPAGNMELLPRGGKANQEGVEDTVQTYSAKRYAKQFVVDEQDIIDDDMNALRSVPMEMGQAAARLRPDMVYYILKANAALDDGTALFATARGNLKASGGVYSTARLQAAISAMGVMTESAGNARDTVKINVNPRYLIVPKALEFAASIDLESSGRFDTSALGTFNPLKGRGIQLVTDSRLDLALTDPISGSSAAADTAGWYLVGDPALVPTIEVGILRGTNGMPTVRSFVLTEGQWGLGWDIKHDIGATALAGRGMYHDDGAAA
jgi:hypothetical protein